MKSATPNASNASVRSIDAFVGVNASMALPMTKGFEPDYQGLGRYARWLVDQGVTGVTVNADTGEGAHLSLEERIRVIESVKSEVGEAILVASGLIASHTQQAVEIASALRTAGADALLVFGIPAFNGKPLPSELVYQYFASLSECDIPLIGFNLTASLGGVVFEPEVIARIATIDNLVALKEASFDAASYVASRDALRSAAPNIAFLSGCDNFMYESFVLGADGALLGYAGLAAELTCQVFGAVASKDFERAETLSRDRMQPLAEVLFGAPVRNSRARIKEGLRLLGLIDETTVRPPLLPLQDSERAAVKAAMTVAGLL
ncbi:dihydrodipicolinate synthase family protein [Nocardia sp. CA-119907]|uniref:dihydrodipicolinate synthase family protein n=1 Tax=Nocardia sp. CA-119907 TaxID=3239973 RepID=UPI003D967A19